VTVSLLSDFEDRVGGAVEGLFAGVFRSPVQPAELARASGREMDRRKKLGVGKVYAPTMYSILLSPADADQLGGFADTLAGELETYLIGYAREKNYELATRPRVQFLVDEELRLGRFDVIGELLSAEEIVAEFGEEPADEPMPEPAPKPTPIPAPAISTQVVRPREVTSRFATLTDRSTGRRLELDGDRFVLGRLKGCDICLQDHNASREHAALVREGAGWVLEDLGSTNGTLVNGEEIDRVRLRDGDVVTIGVTEFDYRDAGVVL
jgi:hypothetical protein